MPALAFAAPAAWNDDLQDKPGSELSTDLCIINNEYFFIRVVLKIPIIDTDQTLEWGVWVSLSEKNFKRYRDIFGTKQERREEPYFGWFGNQLPGYPDCSAIKTQVHLTGEGFRPELELDHADLHPLCQEQHNGITLERAHELVQAATH